MYDLVIVGGGVVGASVAYHAALAGASTVLVDRRDAGRATDAGAGIITPGGDPASADPWRRICGCAEQYYATLVERLEQDGAGTAGYGVCGSMTVAVAPGEMRAFAEVADGLQPETKSRTTREPVLVSGDRARALFPPLGHVEGAAYSPTGARVDGKLLADALTRAAARHGARLLDGSVARIRQVNGQVTHAEVGQESLETGYLVIAGGAWSAAFGDQLGMQIPVAPQRGQIVHLDLGETSTEGWTIVSGMRHHYIVPWDDHRVVVGATRESGAGYCVRPTVGGVHEVLDEAIRVAPGLRDATIREIRVGLRPLSADGYPILGRIPTTENAFVVTGHGPMGLHLGPYSGKLVAEEALGSVTSDLVEAFGVARF